MELENKFDICLMNPPYQRRLCDIFFEKTLQISNKVCTIHPIHWLTYDKQNKKITKLINGHVTNIELLNGNEYFKVGLFANLSINYVDLTKEGRITYNNEEYDTCEDIKPYSHDKYLTKFVEKLGNVKESLWDKVNFHSRRSKKDTAKENDYCIKLSDIRGHVTSNLKKEASDFYTIISNNNDFLKTQRGLYKDIQKIPNRNGNLEFGYVAFKTEKELNNFINYIKTDFVRSCLRLSKVNVHLFRCLANIPWQNFNDEIFSKTPSEIDKYLFKKYDVSDDLIKELQEQLPDYYGIRK